MKHEVLTGNFTLLNKNNNDSNINKSNNNHNHNNNSNNNNNVSRDPNPKKVPEWSCTNSSCCSNSQS